MGSLCASLHGLGSAAELTAGYTAVETTANAIPVVGPFVAATAAILQAFKVGYGCGGTCTQATQVVNQIAPLMLQNLTAAQNQAAANGGCLTQDEQNVLVSNFKGLWQQVLTGCGQVPAPGGTQCIADRQPGGKYDWTSYYLTPITAFPICAASATTTATASGASGVSGATGVSDVTGISSSLLIPIGLIALAALFLGGSK